MKKIILILATVCSLAFPAQGVAALSGNKFYELCRPDSPNPSIVKTSKLACIMYLEGVGDGHGEAWILLDTIKKFLFEGNPSLPKKDIQNFKKIYEEAEANAERFAFYCIPDGVNLGQIRDVVLKYLDKNPQERHYPTSYLALNALSEA